MPQPLRTYAWFSRRPWALPAAVVLVLGVAALGALRLEFQEDVFALLPADEPRVAEARLALERYGGLERVVIGLESDAPDALHAAVATLEQDLPNLPGVAEVTARVSTDVQDAVLNHYAGAAPLLFDADLRRQIDERLTTEYFQQRLQRFVDAQAGAEGPAFIDTFRADPFGFDELVFRRFERLNTGFAGRTDSRGHILSRDGRIAVVFLQPDFPASDTGRGRAFMAELDALLAGLPQGVTPHVVGAHRSSADNAVVLRRDILVTVGTSVAAIVLLFVLLFRSVVPIFVPLAAVGFGFVVALGAQGLLRGEINALTVGFSAVLLGIAVDYSIHLVATYGGLTGTRDKRAGGALAHVARPATAAMLTTAAAVLMLRFSRFDGLHQLAEMAVAGLAGALVFALTAGAQMLRVAGPTRGATAALDGMLRGVEHARRRLGRGVFTLAVLVSVPLGLMANSVAFDGDVLNLDGKSARTEASEAVLERAFGQETFRRTLVVSGGTDLQAALRANDAAAVALRGAGAEFEGPAWVLPGRETQRANLRRWRQFFSEARIEAVKEQMAAAEASRPGTGEPLRFEADVLERRFPAFFRALRAEAPPALLDAAELRQGPLWEILGAFVNTEPDAGRVYVAATAVLEDAQLAEVRARAPHALVLNKAAFVGRMVEFIRRDLLLIGGLALLVVWLVAWVVFRRAGDAVVALMPVVLALVWTLGLMSILGIPFNIINTLVTVFVAGLGVDYGIFLVRTWRESGGDPVRMRHASAGILVAALTTLCGFGSLTLAGHPALFSVGITTGIGVVSALLAALFVVPAVLESLEKRRQA
jgi:uncharacterized protein